MPFSDFTPPLPPASARVVDTTVSGTCQMCEQPSTETGLCPYHYYVEAVNGRGKQWATLAQRKGKWVPPLILVAVLFISGIFLSAGLVFYFCFIMPIIMLGCVFGFGKPKPPQQGAHHWYDISNGYR